MPQSRRRRVDSTDAAHAAFQAAASGELLPPDHNQLPDAAMPFWRDIVQGRAREEWRETPALLSTAASLAWTQWQISKLRGMFDGTEEMPAELKSAMLVARLLDLQRLEMAYLRTLQQHGRGAQGEKRDADNRRAIAKADEAVAEGGTSALLN